jgi:hypothetical protein
MTDDETLAAIDVFRRAANRGATAVISGRSSVDDVVAWFMKETAPVLGAEETLE